MKLQSAFTKIDLVIVLACIIFLISNIAAVGEGGRRRAKQAVCLSNLLKWGQVFQAYTADNDGYFHKRQVGTPAGWTYQMWPCVYKPLYKDPIMRFCPAAENLARHVPPFGTWGGPGWDYGEKGAWNPTVPEAIPKGEDENWGGSYGMSKYIENAVGFGMEDNPGFWRRAGVKGAAQAPVLFDSMYVGIWGNSKTDPPEYEDAVITGDGMANAVINRHNGSINVCFLDFSARKVGLKEIWTLKWSRTFNTCGPWTICGGVQPNYWPEWMRDFEDY